MVDQIKKCIVVFNMNNVALLCKSDLIQIYTYLNVVHKSFIPLFLCNFEIILAVWNQEWFVSLFFIMNCLKYSGWSRQFILFYKSHLKLFLNGYFLKRERLPARRIKCDEKHRHWTCQSVTEKKQVYKYSFWP